MCVWNNIFQNWILASTMCPRDWVHVVRSGSVFPCRTISTPHTKCLSVLQGGVQDPREADLSEGHSLNDAWERSMWPTSSTLGSVSLVTFDVETENWPKEGAQSTDLAASAMAEWTQAQTRSWGNSDSPPSKEKSQHSKVQLDWRKTCTVTSADAWEVRCLCTKQLGSKLEWPQASPWHKRNREWAAVTVNDYSRTRRFYEEIMRNERGQFNDRRKAMHGEKIERSKSLRRNMYESPGVDANLTHFALITTPKC